MIVIGAWATPGQTLRTSVLPRDARRKRGHCCRLVSVRPSVRLSVTFVYCIQMAEDIVRPLSRPSSPIILVFLTPSAETQFQEEPLQGAQNTRVGKNLRLLTEIAVYLGNGTR